MSEKIKAILIKLILLMCTFLLIFFTGISDKGDVIGIVVLISLFIVLLLSSNKDGRVKENAGKKFLYGIVSMIPIMVIGFYHNYFLKILFFIIISIFILFEERLENLNLLSKISKKCKNK